MKGKRHPALWQRLGFISPIQTTKQVIWFHAVSLGEIKAAQPLILLCKKREDVFVVVTTTTLTGQEEAKQTHTMADAVYYLPLDFRFSVRRFVQKIKPQMLVLVESDFWPNLLREIKEYGAKIILVNGKMSNRSYQRWNKFPQYARKIFDALHLLCVQNEDYAVLFRKITQNHSKIRVTGNLKLDAEPRSLNVSIPSDAIYLTLSCTHASEEEWLLHHLKKESWKFFLAPRHPERFHEVADLLKKEAISFIPLSLFSKRRGDEKVILVDSMGNLPFCYAMSQLAIVGGSFVSHVGGHNIFEPCLYGCPVLFGPHMFSQKELVHKILSNHAGLQIELDQLKEGIQQVLQNHSFFVEKTKSLVSKARGVKEAVFQEIQSLLKKN